MPLTVQPTITPLFMVEPKYDGKIEPLSSMDISCHLKDPTFLGKFVARTNPETYLAWLMNTGNELVKMGDNVLWKEEGYKFVNLDVIGAGLVTRSGNTFTLNPSAVVIDDDNIDTCGYSQSDIAFGFSVKEQILVVDATGKEELGIVSAIATDRKSATILSKENAEWAVGTTNLDMIQTGKSLDRCEAPACVGFRFKDKYLTNTFNIDGDCYTYCEEDLYNKSNYQVIFDEEGGSQYYKDKNLDDLQTRLWNNADRQLLFGKQSKAGSAAAAADFNPGTNGILEQVKQRGYGWTGFIENKTDLYTIDDLRRRIGAPKDALINANSVQYRKLQTLVTDGYDAAYNPFDLTADTMLHLGVKGIDVDGRNYYFKRWAMLDQAQGSQNLEKAYNFIITPEGDNKIVYSDGTSENVGYVTVVWNGGNGITMKMRRYVTDEGSGNIKVEYKNALSVVVAQAEHFLVGKPL